MISLFKKYWVTATGEYWNVKEEYKDWWMGRIEVFDNESQYDIDEYRYQFPFKKASQFQKFMSRWEIESINWFQLQYIKWIIKHKFYDKPNGTNNKR